MGHRAACDNFAFEQITDCTPLELQTEVHLGHEMASESTYRTRIGPLRRLPGSAALQVSRLRVQRGPRTRFVYVFRAFRGV